MQLFKDYKNRQRLKKIKEARKIEVRTVTMQDAVDLGNLIEKYAEDLSIENVTRLISSAQTAADPNAPEADKDAIAKQVHLIGLEILKKISTIAKDDAFSFFASLINKTSEEFLGMPIDTPLIIIDQIRSAPEAESFFIMQSLWHKLTETYGDPLKKLKEWYDSTSDEPEKEQVINNS